MPQPPLFGLELVHNASFTQSSSYTPSPFTSQELPTLLPPTVRHTDPTMGLAGMIVATTVGAVVENADIGGLPLPGLPTPPPGGDRVPPAGALPVAPAKKYEK